ncbi:hypothetical protein ACJDU8_16640 [Clostridium sp. WILCCON 0269]|uniref:Uncharacterized protein n=1 Tax=Candidatus Clostridium eludens TaxID=3381663 RepID=A0ABW8SN60_9CLOT
MMTYEENDINVEEVEYVDVDEKQPEDVDVSEEQPEGAEDISEELESILVGDGNYNSACRASNRGKGIGVLYQHRGAVKTYNGRIIDCDDSGYIVRYCSDASKGKPFKYSRFYFYNEKYFRTHKINHSHAYAFIDIGITNNKNVFSYYGKREGTESSGTHNGVFDFFNYVDPKTGEVVSSSSFSTFLSFTKHPDAIANIVYYHYVQKYIPKAHKTVLNYVKTSASDIKHYGKISSK